MKTSLQLLIYALFLLFLSACSNNNSPDVWGIKLGESRSDVIKSIKARGYDVDPSSSKVMRIIASIPYREITWNEIECTFNYEDKLETIVFTSFDEIPQVTIDKLSKYILADGFISTYDKEGLTERLLRGEAVEIHSDERFKKVPYMAIVASDKLLSSHPVTTMTYCTIEYLDKKEGANDNIRERLERGEEVTIEIDYGK